MFRPYRTLKKSFYTCDSVPAGSTLNISGVMGHVTIKGPIGDDATISHNDIGNLYIEGSVGENVEFKLGCLSKVFFAKRPPQSVLDKIQKPLLGELSIPQDPSQLSKVKKSVSAPAELFNRIRQDNNTISIYKRNGMIAITQDGLAITYKGQTPSFVNGKLHIDGIEATTTDDRIIRVRSTEHKNDPAGREQDQKPRENCPGRPPR